MEGKVWPGRKRRKKFLVSGGKSGAGKTELMRGLFRPDKTSELD